MRGAPVIATFLGWMLVSAGASAQEPFWQQTNGPGGGFVHSLASAPDGRLYAVVGSETYLDSRVYRSDDDGDSWLDVSPPADEILTLAAGPAGLLVAARERDGFFRSRDAGQTWQPLDFPGNLVRAFVFDAEGHLLAGALDGVYRSGDDGETWEHLGLEGRRVLALATAGPGTLAAGTYEGLYRSTDGGASWEAVDSLITPTALAGLPNGDVFVGASGILLLEEDTGVYRLAQSGELSFVGLKDLSIATLAVQAEGPLFAGTVGTCTGFICLPPAGVYRSPDGGTTWQHAGLASTAVSALAFDAQGRLVAGTQGLFTDTGPLPGRGLMRTADEGETWTPIGLAFPYASTYALAPAPGGVLYAAADHSVYRSRDQGTTWTPIYTREPTFDTPWAPYYGLAADAEGALLLLAGNPACLDGGIRFVAFLQGDVLRSTDHGETWTTLDLGVDDFFSVGSLAATPAGTLLLAPSQGGILRSEDHGETWTLAGTGLPPGQPVLTIEPGGGRLFAATWDTRAGATRINLFASTDEGQSWTPIGSQHRGLWPERTLLAAGQPETLYVGSNTMVRYTEHDGAWTAIELPPAAPVLALEVDANGILYVATWDRALRSTDGGETFAAIDAGLLLDAFSREIHALAAGSDRHLYAGLTHSGVFRSVQPVRTGTAHGPDLPVSFHLGQNYPNPFNAETRLPLTLSRSARVTLTVYDVLGREAATLIDDAFVPAGHYEVSWNAAGQASGLYVYKLIADGAVQAGRMVLLK